MVIICARILRRVWLAMQQRVFEGLEQHLAQTTGSYLTSHCYGPMDAEEPKYWANAVANSALFPSASLRVHFPNAKQSHTVPKL